MNIKFTATLIVGVVLAVFILSNRGSFDIRVAFFSIKTSIACVIVWSFLTGVIYACFIAFFNGLKLREIIRKQKKEIEKIKQQGVDKQL